MSNQVACMLLLQLLWIYIILGSSYQTPKPCNFVFISFFIAKKNSIKNKGKMKKNKDQQFVPFHSQMYEDVKVDYDENTPIRINENSVRGFFPLGRSLNFFKFYFIQKRMSLKIQTMLIPQVPHFNKRKLCIRSCLLVKEFLKTSSLALLAARLCLKRRYFTIKWLK